MILRTSSAAACATVVATLLASGAHAAVASPQSTVTVLTSRPVLVNAPQGVQTALWNAQQAAARSGDDLAPPYIDRRTGAVVVPGVQGRSTKAVRTALSARVETRTATAKRSVNELSRIQHEVIGLSEAQLPGSSAIYASYVDAEHNRVIVEARSVPAALLAGLSARYGPDAIAVAHVKGGQAPGLRARNADTAPFYGGASMTTFHGSTAYQSCTTGFSWRGANGQKWMITAGHCAGDFTTLAATARGIGIGTINASWDENWHTNFGSMPFTLLGHPAGLYHGDIARINLTTANSSRVYSGPAWSSNETRRVTAMPVGGNHLGQQLCSSGSASGEQCGWIVTAVNADIRNETGTIMRNVTTATKLGQCFIDTDSGGPVYALRADGSVTAAGIINAGSGGGVDEFAGPGELPCFGVFTDIMTVRAAFGGSAVTTF